MLHLDIWNIVADYASPDVNVYNIYTMDWSCRMFFQMELSNLSDIINNLKSSVVKNIIHHIEKEDILDICNILSLDRSRNLAPNIDSIYNIMLFRIFFKYDDDYKDEYNCQCCHDRYREDRGRFIDSEDIQSIIQIDEAKHNRWMLSIINRNVSHLSRSVS
jgi:hypothetical protein